MEINWRNIAEMAYEKYEKTNNYEVEPWCKLLANDQAAWIAAVKTACDVFSRAVTA